MKNMIEFYYNIRIDTLHSKNDYYFFSINNRQFIFKPYYRDERAGETTYRLSNILSERINIDNIILNKYNSPITKIENTPYILILNKSKNIISLPIISNISNIGINSTNYIKNLERNNWEILWGNIIDYYEMQVNENYKKYPLVRESFDYFIGMGENAISYLVNTKMELKPTIYDNKVLSHNNLYSSLFDPSNIILDHKARDVAEYIKYSFWNNNSNNIFKELEEYFKYNFYSVYGIRVLFSRILYPSFYFNMYDQIISGKKEEKELNTIISKINDYEYYLYNIYLYLRKYYDIPEVNWIKKQGINPR